MIMGIAHIVFMIAISASVGACTTMQNTSVNSDDAITVIERSKESAPAWAVSPTDSLQTIDINYGHVTYRDRLLDLPLGLKQTQITALENSERALAEFIRSYCLDLARNKGLSSNYGPEFDKQINDLAKAFQTKFATIQDIYFERVSHDRPISENSTITESYRIYVLVMWPKHEFPALLTQLGKRFANAKDTSLRNLGLIINQDQKQITSH